MAALTAGTSSSSGMISGTHRRDSEWVDLTVTLGVVLLDVREFRRASEGLVVPVKVAEPPRKVSIGSRWVG